MGRLQTVLLRVFFELGATRATVPRNKIGCVLSPPPFSLLSLHSCRCFPFRFNVVCVRLINPPAVTCNSGQLVWRRHAGRNVPSRHAIRATCTDLLPLVEMYCRWVLQEDCSNLRALMVRFDSEARLQSHELGRALLLMLRDEDVGFEMPSRQLQLDLPVNPFEAIRSRLSAVDTALQGLQAQVHLTAVSNPHCTIPGMFVLAFTVAVLFFSALCSIKTLNCNTWLHLLLCPPFAVVFCLPFLVPFQLFFFPSCL